MFSGEIYYQTHYRCCLFQVSLYIGLVLHMYWSTLVIWHAQLVQLVVAFTIEAPIVGTSKQWWKWPREHLGYFCNPCSLIEGTDMYATTLNCCWQSWGTTLARRPLFTRISREWPCMWISLAFSKYVRDIWNFTRPRANSKQEGLKALLHPER